jgi:hypothetical protein
MANLLTVPHPQASSPQGLQPELLIILNQVKHRVVDMTTNLLIAPKDHACTPPVFIPVLILSLIVITAIKAALPPSSTLPQLANLLSLINIPAHLVAVEEESRMEVVATMLTLLHCADIADEVVENRVTLTLSNKPV